jgi:hypothetical protein
MPPLMINPAGNPTERHPTLTTTSTPVPPSRTKWRLLGPAALAATIVCTLTACSIPNLSMSSAGPKAKTSSTVSQPTPVAATPTPAAITSKPATVAVAAVRPTGDLDTGTVTHKVPVGAFSAVIVYYTADNAKLYRDSSTKTVRIAVHLEGADAARTILVNNLVATADDGITRTIVKRDARSFAITPPQSYNSVLTIPATTNQSTAVTLVVELDFSVQISPTSKLYAAQTALDNITLPLLAGSQS